MTAKLLTHKTDTANQAHWQTCHICGERFQTNTNRKTCSAECYTVLASRSGRPRMYHITDDELIKFWHSNLSTTILAKQTGIEKHCFVRYWNTLKRTGRLPNKKRRSTTVLVNDQLRPNGREVEYHCLNCGESFLDRYRTSQKKHKNYCSTECRRVAQSQYSKLMKGTPEARLAQSLGLKKYYSNNPDARLAVAKRNSKPSKTLICVQCGDPFSVPRKSATRQGTSRKTCSDLCRHTLQSNNTKAHNKIKWADPDEHLKLSESNKRRWKENPEYVRYIKQRASEWLKQRWKDPVFRHKQTIRSSLLFEQVANSPDIKKQASERAKRVSMLSKTMERLLEHSGELQWVNESLLTPLWFWQEYTQRTVSSYHFRRRHFLAKMADDLIEQTGVEL